MIRSHLVKVAKQIICATCRPVILRRLLSLFCLALLLIPAFVRAAGPVSASKDLLPFEPGDSIETIRKKIEHNGYSFTVKDYSPNSAAKRFIPGRHRSLTPSEQTGRRLTVKDIKLRETLPIRFDWRDQAGKSFIGPVRDQGNAGTCFAFAACAAAEGAYNIGQALSGDQCIDFSESYIAWTLGQIEPYSDHFGGAGGADYDYFELFALTMPGEGTTWEGVCLESDFPYQDYAPTESQVAESKDYPRVYFDDWGRVYPENYEETTAAIKAAIMTYGVLDVAVDVTDAFDGYGAGVYEDTNTSTTQEPYYYAQTNHAVALVGWDDAPPEGGGGCWILRNSWGPSWGEDGYMRIRYRSAQVNCAATYLIYDAIPSVYTGGFSQLTSSQSLTVNGQASNFETMTSAWFEYGPSTAYGSVTTAVECAGGQINQVEGQMTGLEIGRIYHYRLVAPDAQGLIYGEDQQIDFSPPEVCGQPTHTLYGLSVRFDAAADTHRLPASIHFEYGPTIDCDQASAPQAVVGTDVAAELTVNDLLPGIRYWYRAVVENALGRAESNTWCLNVKDIIYWDGFERDEEGWGGWTQEFVSGEEPWMMSEVWGVVSGENCAEFYPFPDEWLEDQYVTRLVSPTFDLPDQPIQLAFWHMQESCDDVQDVLKVYYRNSPEASWTLIDGAQFDEAIEEWTRWEFLLPNPSPQYQIAFEATSNDGFGVFLDDVSLTLIPVTAVHDWTLYDAVP